MQDGRIQPTRADLVIRQELAVIVLKTIGVKDRSKGRLSDSHLALSHSVHMGFRADPVGKSQHVNLQRVLGGPGL